MAAAKVAASALLVAATTADENPVIELDMFRAMAKDAVGSYTEQNDDLADLTGVLKYIHTECIAEHTLDVNRKKRKNDIDVLAKLRFKVKNPSDLLSGNAQQADFGPFEAYDNGQSTNAKLDDLMSDQGDFVGIQLQANDFRYPSYDPFYWFSVSGFCPNLPWRCTKGAASEDCYGQKPLPPTDRCANSDAGSCPGKGTPDNPNKQCLTYFEQEGKYMKGGLCPDGTEPTGEHGCVYSYDKKAITTVDVDELVGIYDLECREVHGENRKCTDWLDFKRHCVDPELRKKFGEDGRIVMTTTCTEYDVHPACVNSCDDAACKNAEVMELGLPFWKGRCDPKQNRIRVERAAKLFGIADSETTHTIVDPKVLEKPAPCTGHDGAGVCQPDWSSGGPACSRAWSGVCTQCYIPGATHWYPANATQPLCPIDILTLPDYADVHDNLVCKPNPNRTKDEGAGLRPRDLCCLYLNQCGEEYEMDPTKTSLDEDGLAVAKYGAIYKKDTQVLIDFLTRVAAKEGYGKYVKDVKGVTDIAYWQWSGGLTPTSGPALVVGDSLDTIKKKMKNMFTDVKPPPAPTPAPTPSGGASGGDAPVGMIVGVVAAVLAAVIAAGCLVKKFRQAREPAIQDNLLEAANRA